MSIDYQTQPGLAGIAYDAGAIKPVYDFDPTEDAELTGFNEQLFQSLYELECGLPLLFERIRQNVTTCREVASFMKKRAALEEDYSRGMLRLAKQMQESYLGSETKEGSFMGSYLTLLKRHETVAENRMRFSLQLSDVGDDLLTVAREMERSRKITREQNLKLEKELQEQDGLVEKARARFDNSAEELEKLLLLKHGESLKDPTNLTHASVPVPTNSKRSFGKAISKLKGPKTTAQVARQEEDVRARMGQTNDAYRSQVMGAQSARQDYFNIHLPRMLRLMKDQTDEIELASQFHLSRYSFLYERTLVAEGLTISPMASEDDATLRTLTDSIDLRDDFQAYMQAFTTHWRATGTKSIKRELNAEHLMAAANGPTGPTGPSGGISPGVSPGESPAVGSTPLVSAVNTGSGSAIAAPPAPANAATFGIDLESQIERDGTEAPRILEKCFEIIENYGLESVGIYRLSGTTSRVRRLKQALDSGIDIMTEEYLSDINDVAGVTKLWLRELPEPLFTFELYHRFIEHSALENERLRQVRLHETVNELPDANYSTLKLLMAHLDKIQQNSGTNQMSISNLAIVFGPNLLSPPPPNSPFYVPEANAISDMNLQCKCVETILSHYQEIFVQD